ncbi:AAA family ATPase [Aeromicrobium sp. Marseille-Q0843]|uniref:AAA family ATPase n=1 Tax=Aeromicrobium phoceense TaxID=2754045 RepID=A0A838XMZ1_9ACTN|nr:ATP-binding protein [Aeromicrobium phoceense]MBA4608323.1 AAA family ATPase [Aeromicrobium phoceense]
MSDALFDNLFAALEAAPEQHDLRLQVARMLLERGRVDEAAEHASIVLRARPSDAAALEVLTRAASGTAAPHEPPDATNVEGGFDWSQAEDDLDLDLPPPFVSQGEKVGAGGSDVDPVLDIDTEVVVLDDVGGLDSVKQRINEAFLDPMRPPEIAQAFGTSLRGGLILYGPPGCGKTFIAKAIAGGLGVRFLTASIADVMGPYQGESEKNLQRLFAAARELAPAVLFLDEIDGLGAKRSGIGSGFSGMRAVVNQLLIELDSVGSDNDGLFVLAATNQPWEVDQALLRPGRFDRMLLVVPPDAPARAAIVQKAFARRPIAGIDVDAIVARTEGFSGADLTHLVEASAQKALTRSLGDGQVRPIGMDDVVAALAEIRPSTTSWLQSARNVVEFANADGRYDELEAYLKSRRIR